MLAGDMIAVYLDSKKVGKAVMAKALAAPGISELVTVPNVPMVSTGIDYPTSTGLITFTEQHLLDLIASQDDTAIHPPRTKIGHSDPRFNATVTPDGDVLDGEPSLGSWMNLRLGDNGQTVYGDLVGCPKWFAAIASTAYPSRSVEGNFDVETVTGHKWSLVVDAVAMLGVIGPGVTTLADLPILFSEEGPEGVQVIEAKEGEPMSVVRAAGSVRAQAQIDDIRRQFYDSLEGSQYWWWIRAMYVDPGELIVDDDEGCLYRVGYTTADDGTVSFAEPVPVKIQYVDQPKEDEVAAAAIRASVALSLHPTVTASFNSREQSRPGGSMDRLQIIAALRLSRGLTPEQLPDDADEATVMQMLQEPVAAAAPTEATPPPEGGTSTSPEGEGGEPRASSGTAAPAAPSAIPSTAEASRIPGSTAPQVPEGTIMVDRATWEAVAGQAREGAELAARTRDEERDKFLNEAVKAGKFPPSRKEHYLNAWKADAEGTRGLIDSLATGLVPVEARGTAGTGKDEQVRAAEANSYDQNWLTPSERARINQSQGQQAGTTPQPMVIQGGD